MLLSTWTDCDAKKAAGSVVPLGTVAEKVGSGNRVRAKAEWAADSPVKNAVKSLATASCAAALG